MRNRAFGIIAITLLISGFVYAGGTATQERFYSEALERDQRALVYLPEGYESSGLDYPVIYLLHGAGGGVNSWYLSELIPAMDEMISDGLIDPVIVVEPVSLQCPAPIEWRDQGFTYWIWHFHANSELIGNYEDFLVEDVVGWVDTTYRTIAGVEHRWLLGRSAGGHGAMRLALLHPDVFSAASIDSGFMAIADAMLDYAPAIRNATFGPPYSFAPSDGFYTSLFFAYSAVFAPNPDNPPWYVDFILNEDGEVNNEVYQRLAAQSPPALVHAFADSGLTTDLFLRIGDHDEFEDFFWPVIDALEETGLPHTLRVFEGDHDFPPMSENLAIHLTYLNPIKATVDISPRLADPRLLPGRMRLALELPGDLDATEIDCSTLELVGINGTRLDCAIDSCGSCEISDLNGNGRDDLSVWLPCSKLVRAAHHQGASAGELISLTVRGELQDGRFFQASDEVVLRIDTRTLYPLN